MYAKITLPSGFSVEERQRRAMELFREGGYNCCQAVALAFSDICAQAGISESAVATLSSGFGGGMARMREVCGTVSGMTFLAGVISPATNPTDRSERTSNYALVQELAAAFRAANGSIVCRELLGQRAASSSQQCPVESPQPSERTPEFYATRPCERLVGSAAGIVAGKLIELYQNE